MDTLEQQTQQRVFFSTFMDCRTPEIRNSFNREN